VPVSSYIDVVNQVVFTTWRWVVADSELVFGMSRMYELRKGEHGAEVRAFRDVQEARAWPGLEPADG
jgi:hypothetical protein